MQLKTTEISLSSVISSASGRSYHALNVTWECVWVLASLIEASVHVRAKLM